MKQYKVTIETNEREKYETSIETKYELEQAIEHLNSVRPDTFVRIGDIALRAGDIKTAGITGTIEEDK